MWASSCRRNAAQALAELFGTPLSEGTVAAMSERAADGLDGFLDALREPIVDSTSAGFDETGLRVPGKLHWVHCARTGRYTLITCHTKRGREGIDDAGVLARFSGDAVHDACAPYDTFIEPEHQLCCAHALRDCRCRRRRAACSAGLPVRYPTRWSDERSWSRRSYPAPRPSIPMR